MDNAFIWDQKEYVMTIGNAIIFIKRAMDDSRLRERLNSASSMQACNDILAEEHLLFSRHEFEEAFRNQLTLCQEAEAADRLSELKMWWDFLSHSLSPASSGHLCKGCC